jgi:hypothetical protein
VDKEGWRGEQGGQRSFWRCCLRESEVGRCVGLWKAERSDASGGGELYECLNGWSVLMLVDIL